MSGGGQQQQLLTPVGSPSRRIQRRSIATGQSVGPGSPLFPLSTPKKPSTPGEAIKSDSSGLSFAERVQRNIGQQTPLKETENKKPPKEAHKPLSSSSSSAIPDSVLDVPSQRLYALSVAGLLVAWKTYDAIGISLESGQTSGYLFAKWTLLDWVLLYVGWRLRIPKLGISTVMLYGLAAASVFLNLNLFLLSSSVLMLALKPVGLGVASNCMRTVKSIPLVGPWIVGDSELLIDSFRLDDEHILGRHTIHVLPHSMAHMNPAGKSLCISNDAGGKQQAWYSRLLPSGQLSRQQQQRLTIPIVINGTRPASIAYAFTSFETGERQLRAVKNVRGLRMETMASYPVLGASWVLATYYLPVSEEGAYEMHSVRDERGLEFRTMASAQPTVVVRCPTARLAWHGQQQEQGDSTFAVG
ncbi:hypothetical protein IWW38_003471, partial [Coemansia aciculifera]